MKLNPKAWWDALRSTPRRGNYAGKLTEAVQALKPYDREQFSRIVRQLEQDDAFINRVLDLMDTYVFGTQGLRIYSASTDEVFAAEANRVFSGWSEFPDIGSRMSWAATQKLIGGSWGVDGGVFVLLTEERNGAFTRPRIELIEDHLCKTPPTGHANPPEGNVIIDGIEVDRFTGRAVNYHFGVKTQNSTGNRPAVWRAVPADQIIHITDPRRVGQRRSPSMFYAVLNEIIDLREWQELTKHKLKDSAETAKVYKSKGGASGIDQLRRRMTEANATVDPDSKVDAIRKAIGAKVIHIDHGDEVMEFAGSQPADQTQRFWETVARRACAGVNLPFEVVFPQSIQGTMARAVFDMAHAHFSMLQAMFAEHFSRVWRYVIEIEAQDGNAILRNRPADWRATSYIGPRAINVDIGYQSAAAINEIEFGLKTFSAHYGGTGQGLAENFRQLAREVQLARQIEQEFALPPGTITRKGITQ